jgi:outer membrane receptor protein involved in Fe transport
MKQIYLQFATFLILTLVLGNQALGQRDTSKLNQNVEVVKPYQPSIGNAQKLNQMPVIEDTTHFTPEFNYSIESHPFNSGFKVGPIGAAEVKSQPENSNGIGYIKLGVATYNTTYGDFYLNNPKSKVWAFGLHLQHLASDATTKLLKGDIVDAPYSRNKAEIFGSGLIGESTLSAGLSYNRDMVSFYGYPDTIPHDIYSQSQYAPYFGSEQVYQKTAFNIALKSNEGIKSDFKYNSGFRYFYFDAKTGQQESSGGLFADFDYQFDKFKGLIESSFDQYTTKGILTSPTQDKRNSWLKLSPAILFSEENWSLKGGVSFYSVFAQEGESIARLYPKIELKYFPAKDNLTLFAGVDGYLQNCSYSEIAYENNWVDPMHNLTNADHRFILFGGVKGKISKQITYNITAKYDDVKDAHFYILKSAATAPPLVINNAFDVLYDNTGITNLSAELSYVLSKDYSFKFKANYYSYNLEKIEFAPLLPDFDLEGTADFRIIDRMNGFADLNLKGARYGLIQFADDTNQKYEMKSFVRVNLGADYELNDKIKIFGRIDNLFNQYYELFPGYTSQGLRLMVGASLSF